MSKYEYYICDVFTQQKFSGNQLAVITDAEGLSDHDMQNIAREFNFSESTFVFPSEKKNASLEKKKNYILEDFISR